MKKLGITFLSLIFLLSISFSTACSKKTKIEREVEVGPGGSVSQETTVDREVTTGVKDGDVKVETKIDLE